MKKCTYCFTDFEPKIFGGTEQAYCSKNCRNKAGQKRYKEKLMSNGISKTPEQNMLSGTTNKQSIVENNNERGGDISYSVRRAYDNDVIRLMETNYNTKAELIRAEIKLENALKELAELKMENAQLEEELNSEPTKEGVIGMLNEIPEWAGGAIGNLLKSEKIVKFVEGLIPEQQ